MSFDKNVRILVTLLAGFHWIDSSIGAVPPRVSEDGLYARAHRICEDDSMKYNHANAMQAKVAEHYKGFLKRTARDHNGTFPLDEDEISWFGKGAFGSQNFRCGQSEIGCTDMPDCEKIAMHVMVTEPSWTHEHIFTEVRWRWLATLSFEEIAKLLHRLDASPRIHRAEFLLTNHRGN